ncbi:MAG TPA: DUF6496 domain-containing protein [Gammaproteobacteria bacterium]
MMGKIFSRANCAMAKYSKGAQKSVKGAMHKKKRGKLRAGRSGKKVKSRKQAIAIGLSEARKKGAKVPSPKGKSARKKSRSGKRTAAQRASGRRKTKKR